MKKRNYLKLILIKKDFLDKVQLKSTYGGDTYRRRTLSIYGSNIATSFVYSGLWFTVQGYYVIIDTVGLTNEHLFELKAALEEMGYSEYILWYY